MDERSLRVKNCGLKKYLDSFGRGLKLATGTAMGSKGWRSGEGACLPPMWPGFKSRRRRHMWVEFVVGFLLCSERCSSRYSGFRLSSKTNIFKFQFDQESGTRRTTLWMCYLQFIIYLIFIHKPSFECSIKSF